jgi:hypothetical protein
VIVSLGGFAWLMLPYLKFLALPPAQLSSLWISTLIYLALTARVLSAMGNILLVVLGSLVPNYVWALSLAVLAGTGFLWTFSYRRVVKPARSAA